MIGQCAVKLFIFACSVKFNTKKCRFVRNDVPADSDFYVIISLLLFVLARTTGSFFQKSLQVFRLSNYQYSYRLHKFHNPALGI